MAGFWQAILAANCIDQRRELAIAIAQGAAAMPRAKAQIGGLFLGVSPWQDSRGAGEGDGRPSKEQQPGCSVVELPLVVGAAAAAAATASPGGMPVDAQPSSLPPAPAPAPSGGWQAKKHKPAADEGHADAGMAAEQGGGACPLPAAGAAGGEQPPAEAAQIELEGTAYLALLPNGSITGAVSCPCCSCIPGGVALVQLLHSVLGNNGLRAGCL